MISRILPRDEYARLEGTYLEPLAPHLPTDADVIVVEDDGRVIACWALFSRVHLEGGWIHPEYRQVPGVAWKLFSKMRTAAHARGAARLVTASEDAAIDQFLLGIGAEPMDGYRHYVLPLKVH